ncbi:hypothetical protein [Halobaculum magnesiiphilum]|uniref:Uncharacterized protein n=1 Tax=Halobaculum magnesiiphilum TaxID=1017351 RepID=A0A8T8WIY2_9EURY|nr:hypothetical protein [Halobaculum magnesiiphilum]QZP39835.1 hypothetical protein K6T50_18400 [Halobaculum magnesiiphilum]
MINEVLEVHARGAVCVSLGGLHEELSFLTVLQEDLEAAEVLLDVFNRVNPGAVGGLLGPAVSEAEIEHDRAVDVAGRRAVREQYALVRLVDRDIERLDIVLELGESLRRERC